MANDIEVMEPQIEEKEYSLSGGDFFRKHPDKILAEEYEGSGRFGPVKKYRAKKGVLSPADALKEIQTPVFIAHGITDISAGASVIMPEPEKLITGKEDPNIEIAIIESEKSVVKKQRAEKRLEKEFDEPAPKPTIPFEDILRNYNKDLTTDEIKAFLWYMHSQGNTYKGKWLNILNPTLLSQEQESAYINGWINSGILFYYKGELLPAFIYLSENLYDRKAQFEKDKDDITHIYGQQALTAQETKLNEAYQQIYQNRLKLDDPDTEKRLHLKPYGDFTNSIQIHNWNLDNNTGEPDSFYVVISGSEKSSGEINWKSKKTSTSKWRDTSKETLSITDAFRFYLKYDPNRPSLPHNFQWEDLFRYYLDKGKAPKDMDPTVVARNRALAKEVTDKIFSTWLAEIILENDRVQIETIWNEKFNSNLPLRTEKVPVAFEVALSYWGNDLMVIEPEKREGVAFASITGSSLNAYQVGVGKTSSAVFTMALFLDAELCKRPFLVVPNQVYKQFYAEMHGLLPHKKINDFYNLGKDYYNSMLDENGNVQMVEEGSISMFTYEGFLRIGFKEETQSQLLSQLHDALEQIQSVEAYNESKAAQKEAARKEEKLKGMLGKALQKTTTNIEDLGFDFVCFDEAHTLKNIFSQVKAKRKEVGDDESKAGKKMYEITGSTSTKGIKAYCLCSYLQNINRGRNVLQLTATPFSNSPLEIYSMLSLVAYDYLKKMGISNINDFFDQYCLMSYELIINSKLQPIRKQIFKAFDNLQSLQKLIYKFMLHKEAGVADSSGNIVALVRPDKWVLPYKGHFDAKNVFHPATEDQFIDTVLPLTSQQKDMMDEIIAYVEGKISYKSLEAKALVRMVEDEDEEEGSDEDEKKEKEEVMVLHEDSMDEKEKAGVRTLRGVNFSRSLALSPYLYEFSGLGSPDYKQYIESSPKLTYVMECIRSVKKWHEDKKEPVSSQIIYMDRGKKYFELIKDYLVNVIGYKAHEIGIIRSGKEGSAKHKDFVKNSFNGFVFNEASKSFDNIPDADRIKIIIGTSSIREGLNLNRFTTCLYNCSIDWRPTDEIQLEGRCWRQGNTFENVRIIIPLMSDSMDIFMLQKLEEKTQLINSIWDWNGKSNVLKVDELDPKEMKLALITNPKVIAQLKLDDKIVELDEKISEINNDVRTAENIIEFFDKRIEFEKQLMKVLSILEPKKPYPSIDAMAKDFERVLAKQNKEPEFKNHVKELMRENIKGDRYEYKFLDYDYALTRPYSFGNMKAAVASLKKAQRTFFEKYKIADEKEAVKAFIDDSEAEKERIEEEIKNVKSETHIAEMIEEIELERKKKKIRFKSVPERVAEFEKLNYLLSIKASDAGRSEDFPAMEVAPGCPPLKAGDKPDVSPAGIKKLEACLENIPQTKDLNTDETGEYTEKRQRLHKLIKGKLRAGMRCSTLHDKPIAILMGGPPGSGKTTFIKKYTPNLVKEKIFKIDADEIRAMLPEYEGWNSKATHKETRDIYQGLLADISEGKPCRFDILWDGTMNRADNYKPLIGSLRDLNYDIYMIYVKVPWDVSRKRTLERYVNASHDGKYGRYVPMEVVDEANQTGIKGFEQLKTLADGFMVVDGVSSKIVEKGGRDLLADRGYFDKEPTDKDVKMKKAKAFAIAQKQKIEILKLKAA
jgi:predicted kinase